MVAEARKDLATLIEAAPRTLADQHKWQLWEQNAPLELDEYLHLCGRADTVQREKRTALKAYEDRDDARPMIDLGPDRSRFAEAYDRSRHAPTLDGYLRYLADTCPAVLSALVRHEEGLDLGDAFAEHMREEHTHLLAGRGSGKSELLKLLIHHYVKHPQLGAVVVLDPHNDLARAISRWREFDQDPERLVYLDMTLSPEHYPALNPLSLRGLSMVERSEFADLMADAIEAFSASRTMTDNMRTLARNGLRVALEGDTASLADLRRMLGNEQRNPLARAIMDRARKHPELGEWFRDAFEDHSLNTSKAGLAARLDDVLTRPKVGRALRAADPINLEALCDGRKVVVVGLAGEGGEEIGRLLLAQLLIIGRRRQTQAGKPRVPIHVFVDEGQRFIGTVAVKIMNELRKSGVRFTLAHQSLSQFESPALREQVWDASGIKILGATDDRMALDRLLGETSAHIPKYEFAVRWGMVGREGVVRLKTPHEFLRGAQNDMAPKRHAALMAQQLARYYRPLDEPQAAAPPTDSGHGFELL